MIPHKYSFESHTAHTHVINRQQKKKKNAHTAFPKEPHSTHKSLKIKIIMLKYSLHFAPLHRCCSAAQWRSSVCLSLWLLSFLSAFFAGRLWGGSENVGSLHIYGRWLPADLPKQFTRGSQQASVLFIWPVNRDTCSHSAQETVW